MQCFKSPRQARDFLFAHGSIDGYFHPRRHLMSAGTCLRIRVRAFKVWRVETGARYVAQADNACLPASSHHLIFASSDRG